MHFRDHYFFYVVLSLTILMVSASYYRFMVIHDYMIRYEAACDPYTENCYIGCEDDECTEEYFYTEITRHAADIYALCGEDITNCEAADTCSPIDRNCSITHCDPGKDGDFCEILPEEFESQDPSSNQMNSDEIIFDNSQG